jgi:hypothetical protein
VQLYAGGKLSGGEFQTWQHFAQERSRWGAAIYVESYIRVTPGAPMPEERG